MQVIDETAVMNPKTLKRYARSDFDQTRFPTVARLFDELGDEDNCVHCYSCKHDCSHDVCTSKRHCFYGG